MVQILPLFLMDKRKGHPLKTTLIKEGDAMCTLLSASLLRQSSQARREFLSRDTNKQRLVQMISDQLRERDCIVVNAHGDADVDIVKTAVETSLQHTTTVIGEDTDLLVLLLYYAQGEVMNLYFRSDKPKADGTIEVYHINRIQ